MTPRWEEIDGPPPPPEGAVIMDAFLTPNRSLSVRAFSVLIGVVVVINLAVSIIFVLRGAWPVAAFLALDIALLWLAFHINYRAGRLLERVTVAADRIHVMRRAGRKELHYMTHPYWARLKPDAAAVRVAAGGREMTLGRFLSPEERAEFAAALDRALAQARAQG